MGRRSLLALVIAREFRNPGFTHLRGQLVDNVTVAGQPITDTWNLEASG